MKRFLTYILLFTSLIFISIVIVFLQADGTTDPFYLRFTTPQQRSLILGTSRAAQGLQPSVFNKTLLRNDFYNYSFTIIHSPFGSTYLNSIKRKLNSETSDGIFIIAVDPWSICSTAKNPNNTADFIERTKCLGNMSNVNTNPNVCYLFRNFNDYYYKLFKKDTSLFLRDDGWLEVSIDMSDKEMKKRLNQKLKNYADKMLPTYQFSDVRLSYLSKTVKFLKQHGKVYLVRLPIHPEIMKIEDKLMPNFTMKINKAIHLSDGFYDMTPLNPNYIYIDGNHLYKDSGKKVSKQIANWILDKK